MIFFIIVYESISMVKLSQIVFSLPRSTAKLIYGGAGVVELFSSNWIYHKQTLSSQF